MNELSSQNTKYRIDSPKCAELEVPSDLPGGLPTKSFECRYPGCKATISRQHDLKRRHWATHFPLADGDGQACYFCGKVTRQRANMKAHEEVCTSAPHNMVRSAGLQKARRRRSVKKTAPSGKAAATTKRKVKKSGAHTDTHAALIHRRAMDDSLPALLQYPPIQPQGTIRATRKRKTESEAGPSSRAGKKRKLDVNIVHRGPTEAPLDSTDLPPPFATGYPPQTMGNSVRPIVPKPRSSRRTSNRQRSDVAQYIDSTSDTPRSSSAGEDAHSFSLKSCHASDMPQIMGGSRQRQTPELWAYWPLTSSTMASESGAVQRDGQLFSGTNVGGARAEQTNVGGSQAWGATDYPATHWLLEPPPVSVDPACAGPTSVAGSRTWSVSDPAMHWSLGQSPISVNHAVYQSDLQSSSWNNLEATQITPPRDVVECVPSAVDGSTYNPIYLAENSPVNVDSPVASSSISLPSLPSVMATLAARPEFSRADAPERSGRTHWQTAPSAWSPSAEWKQEHATPTYPSMNTVDSIFTEDTGSGLYPVSLDNPSQLQNINSSAHTLGQRGSSSSGSSSGGGSGSFYLMTPPDHTTNIVLQPEQHYYKDASRYSTSRNAGVTIVDALQMSTIFFDYSAASTGYVGHWQPHSEVDPSYGYDT
ncbi:hypothetical protein HYPSUDRAFT_77334 [Hypholoma sublateritium FD-334 SS-4]|uniref:Uncharacterized protein n=1 Tax=Hypholoma sublateritium (strain FD-334 SS-4) TaxID=945553 RepID=A0A0D2NUE9_HYPSF|nr:hypothetical protein HYPSUDRAFT_77334 [Hypholoma sublateritium FD-334 SS-4]